ncbi:LamB/YcsF family protein [Posidoniimonas polymericola]|uniref:LamB/YcsF family protein n=1 Tax=Posidoniimonas polymericola TaxID=2528002 RepID=A0A5C5YQ92_9BACT|nr:5-oxoprolinase subunit PxpA [Posidoniimonas polymericola]TWT77132.1 LamB/YcsF family protein [Posidoniimonas polymericola]
MRSIDLNADVGEGAGNDHELLAYVTSANIACGAHAGNLASMRAAACRAVELGVTIGAHPGHVDREFYGRRNLPITPQQASDLLRRQIDTLAEIAEAAGGSVGYVKPHGALYHQLGTDPALAEAAAAIAGEGPRPLALLGEAGSCMESAARAAGVPFYAEAFADRAYHSSGRLVSRDEPGALHEDEAEVVRQALRLALEGAVSTVDGPDAAVRCDSICLHGDTPWAVGYAAGVRLTLERRGVCLRSFAVGC